MKSVVLDTNALLRYLLDDIPSQSQEVREKIKEAQNKEIELCVPGIVLFEIVYALTKEYGFSKEKVVRGLKKLISADYLVCDEKEIFREAFELYNNANISLADCFIVAYAKARNANIFTKELSLIGLIST